MKAFKITLLLFLILLILVFGAFVALRMSGLELQLSAPQLPLLAPAPPPLPSGDTLPKLAFQPATAEEKLLDQAYAAVWSYTPDGECETDGKTAQQKLTLTVLDADRFAGSGLREELIGRLSQRVEQAQRASEVYDAQFQYLPELVREDYLSLLQERGSHAGDYCQQQSVTLRYVYEDDGWVLQNPEVFYPLQPNAESLYAAAAGDLPYQPLHYTIEENALCGPVPRAKLVKGIGYDWQVMQLGEVTYQFPQVDADSIGVFFYAVPFWPIYKGKSNRIAVSIDGGEPQVFENKFAEYSRSWKDQVMRNGIGCRLHFAIDKLVAQHTVTFKALDPGQMLQKVILDWGGLQPSYIGPQKL